MCNINLVDLFVMLICITAPHKTNVSVPRQEVQQNKTIKLFYYSYYWLVLFCILHSMVWISVPYIALFFTPSLTVLDHFSQPLNFSKKNDKKADFRWLLIKITSSSQSSTWRQTIKFSLKNHRDLMTSTEIGSWIFLDSLSFMYISVPKLQTEKWTKSSNRSHTITF